MASTAHCGEEHGAVVTRLGRVESDVAELRKTVDDIKGLLFKAALVIVAAASTGSAMAPTLKALILQHIK